MAYGYSWGFLRGIFRHKFRYGTWPYMRFVMRVLLCVLFCQAHWSACSSSWLAFRKLWGIDLTWMKFLVRHLRACPSLGRCCPYIQLIAPSATNSDSCQKNEQKFQVPQITSNCRPWREQAQFVNSASPSHSIDLHESQTNWTSQFNIQRECSLSSKCILGILPFWERTKISLLSGI